VATIRAQEEVLGKVEVFYTQAMPAADEGPFLKEERKLIETIAERLGHLITRRRMRRALERVDSRQAEAREPEWWVILDFLRQTDRTLLGRIGRKMVNYLGWSGVEETEKLLKELGATPRAGEEESLDENRPLARTSLAEAAQLSEAAFRIASHHLSEAEILSCILRWIKEERAAILRDPLELQDTPLVELAEALQRFRHSGVEEAELPQVTQLGLRVPLVRRFLTDQPEFISVAKDYLQVADFHELSQRLIYPSRSHGRLGGKAAGLFLAWKIIARSSEYADVLGEIRVPRTWYIPSDGVLDFIRHNHLEEVYHRKYLDPDLLRLEYPHTVHLFKNSTFSPEVLKGLSVVLDDLEDRPLIVRSSSVLEDRLGAAFSGKYKSLFLANRGSKKDRLAALTDAIAEVYASVLSPDAIAYRAEHGLIHLDEEMGIMIQEVVGARVGPYFLPAFSGVGFSNNEFRWSPRIKREDGLLRMVPGLGTRAVDRLADDYPILVAPGQPGLKVNASVDEAVRYRPRRIDVINLESNAFETVELDPFLAAHGAELPKANELASIHEEDRLRRPVGLVDFARERLVVNFEGLLGNTPYLARMRALLKVLREKLRTPVDIEFASDGRHIYLLQCRPQSYARGAEAAPIPRDLPGQKVLFTANRYVSNGQLDLSQIVYVDPEAYAQLEDPQAMREVGRAVGRLNRALPKRQFLLMGPGRWGSRGDIKLGVPVSYADISNTALLVEIARKKGAYQPELSFGTHFFQDLVESAIRYLPLYPDEPGNLFNESFLTRAPSALARLLPDLSHLSKVVRVIDVPETTGGQILRVLMNSDLDEAVAFFSSPRQPVESWEGVPAEEARTAEDHSRWRLRMAQRIAAQLDPERFGVKGFYLLGSSKNAAGPESDIEVLLHVGEEPLRRSELESWLEGWSLCLGEMNFLRTGCPSRPLLKYRLVTDAEIAGRSPAAAAVRAESESARKLPLMTKPRPTD
jgi:hypothetical protein